MSKRTPYKYVAVIGLDGMGVFHQRTETPNLDRIFAHGAVSCSARSMSPTSSAANWGAMLTGASPEVHQLENELDNGRRNDGSRFPSLFARLRREMPGARLSSFVHWKPINTGLIEDGLDLVTDTGGDAELCEKIVAEVANRPAFLFVQFDEIDGAGHTYSYGSDEYLAKITEEDAYVGRIYDAYVQNGMIDDTLFIAVADHGGIFVGHGNYTDEEKYIFLAAAGKHVPEGEIGPALTRDICAIVLCAFGIEIPAYTQNGFTSQVPAGIFDDYDVPYYAVTPVDREFDPRPTPAPDSEGGLFSLFDRERFRLAILFDGDVRDASGHYETTEIGNVVYDDHGVTGSCAVLGDTGSIRVENFSLGCGSFSIAYWARVNHVVDEGFPICSNKDWHWSIRGGLGFGMAFRMHDIIFNLADGHDRQEINVGFPEDVGEGWVHFLHVLDREKREIRIYANFREVYRADLFESLVGVGDTGLPFCIGNDARGDFSCDRYHLLLTMDDFIMFGDALTDKDTETLAAYYGMKPQ